MTCTSCGRANREGARFCGGCGAPLAPRCPRCGAQNEADARFCDACGTALAGAAAPEKAIARKVVTVVFADLIGSVSLHERLEPEAARRVMDRYHRAMTAAVEVHGGRVVQLLGDGVLAAFGVPRVAEDDAMRAVRAGVGMQRAFRELAREQGGALEGVGLRVAINTGEVVVSDDETAVIGDPTNVAARLQSEARDGEVILGESTQRLVVTQVTLAPLGTFALKGRTEAVTAYRVVSLEKPVGAQLAAFVGRDDELRRLLGVFESACSARSARLAVLLGSPGLGKSRLLAELLRRAGERATLLSARCDAARGATFAPIADALRVFLRIEEGAGREVLRAAVDAVMPGDDAERTRVASGIAALLAGAPSPPEETFFVVRRFLAALSAVRPVVLAIDDLHWAEPLLLDLVEHLVQWSANVPLLLVVAARPELRDARSALATPGPGVAEVVTLAGLDARSATQLAANAIGAAELPAALAGRVLAASEGNPLFVGELVRMLVQDGTLRKEGERWVTSADLAALEMPPTIQVLLAARIERLRPEERVVLERAAVIGRQFSRAAIAELLPREASDLDARLEALRRSELIEPDTGWFLGEPGLRFHHVLIRDAAYRRLLKNTRAELHERFAEWVAARAGESLEHDETIGWHFEQAHHNLRELGALDARGLALGARAAARLGAAGRRALARDDVAQAADLLGRALECLAPGDPARADLALDWCEALLSAGDVGPAARAIAELGAFTGASERLAAWHACFRGQLAALTEPQSLRATIDEVAMAAAVLAAAGDAAGEAKAHSVHAGALARLGEIGACENALDEALAAARRARDRRRVNAVLSGAPLAALWGPGPVTRASGRCLDVVRVLRITQGAPAVEAVALRCQAVLETLRGRSGAAQRMLATARRMVEDLGIAQQVLETDVFAGHVSLLEGDAAAAERTLRAAYDGLRARGLGVDAARAGALLGRALLALGRAAEALAVSRESEALGGDDLRARVAWRGVRAEALAQRGEHEDALSFARAGVEIAANTDVLLDHADARLALANVLRAAGREAEAAAERERALALWEAKGATLLCERVRGSTGAAAADAGSPRRWREARGRIRPNAATALVTRFDAAVEAHDLAAILDAHAEDVTFVHQHTIAGVRRDGVLDVWRRALGASDFHFTHTPLATLGESLGLFRASSSLGAIRIEDGGGSLEFGRSSNAELSLVEVDASGRIACVETFGEQHLAEAVVRLYERYAESLPQGAERERAESVARSVAGCLGLCGDPSAFREALAPDVEYRDHHRLGFGRGRGAEQVGRANRIMNEQIERQAARVLGVVALEPDVLAVHRWLSGVDREGGGTVEHEAIHLFSFDEAGRVARLEHFDAAEGDAALARLAELAAPAPSGRPRVAPNFATVHFERLESALAARDDSAFPALWSDGLEVENRPHGTSYGRDAALDRFREMMRESGSFTHRCEPLASLGETLALARTRSAASAVASEQLPVGAYEIDYLSLVEARAPGVASRVELFAPDHLAEAIARLYERFAELQPPGPVRARAEATAVTVSAVLDGGEDWSERVFAADVEFVDHRALGLGSVRGIERLMRGVRAGDELEGTSTEAVREIVALAPTVMLLHRTTCGRDRAGGGAFERDLLRLWAFGADGRVAREEWFDPSQRSEALVRFDELSCAVGDTPVPNAAWRAQQAFERAWRERRWEDVLASYAADVTFDDRRAIVGVPLRGADFLANVRLLFDAPDGRWESQLLATRGERHLLLRVRFAAGPPSARIEVEHLSVSERDPSGRLVAISVFDLQDLERARTELERRFAAAESAQDAGAARSFETAATRSDAESQRAWESRDWERFAALTPPGFRSIDRRPLIRLEVDGETMLRGIRPFFEAGARRSSEVLATRGETLALVRMRVRSDEGEVEWLQVLETDANGVRQLAVAFAPDDLDSACAELDARFETGEASRHPAVLRAFRVFRDGFAARDWKAIAGLLAPDLVVNDRRPLGWETLRGAETYLDSLRELVRLAPDVHLLVDHVALCERGLFWMGRWVGTREGGAFESAWVTVSEHDATGLGLRIDTYAVEQLALARARFEELRGAAAHELLHIPPNAAVRAGERRVEAARAGDWDAFRALCAPDLVFDDRRRYAQWIGGREAYIESNRVVASSGARLERTTLATSGDRLVLESSRFSGGRDPIEVELLRVSEIDAEGRLVAGVLFDADDRRAAAIEMMERWFAREGDRPAARSLRDVVRAMNAHDLEALRRALPERSRFHDFRRTGVGRLDTREEYLASVAALFEQSDDLTTDTLYHVATAEHGSLSVGRMFGTLRDGGAFESVFVRLSFCGPEGDFATELYELDDLERARARFAELARARG